MKKPQELDLELTEMSEEELEQMENEFWKQHNRDSLIGFVKISLIIGIIILGFYLTYQLLG